MRPPPMRARRTRGLQRGVSPSPGAGGVTIYGGPPTEYAGTATKEDTEERKKTDFAPYAGLVSSDPATRS